MVKNKERKKKNKYKEKKNFKEELNNKKNKEIKKEQIVKSKKDNKKKRKKNKQLNLLKNKKIILIINIILFSLIGISFALYSYNYISNQNELIMGNIYMTYSTPKVLSLSNALPRDNLDPNSYIEFTIKGLNKYKQKDISYAIDLLYGDVPNGYTENNRIRDDLLRFTLTKKINNNEEQTVIDDIGYPDLDNLRIYVEKIPKETNNEITHTYKLYMWISNDVIIGNVGQDYTEEQWNNIFASIKIKVTGDFTEKGAANSIKVTFDGNGGTVSEPYKFYEEGDVYGDLPTATRDGYAFEGWRAENNVKVHSNKELQSNENHTLTAVWSIVKYRHIGDYVFDGTNYIDTGVYLFNDDNADRNFYISFDITEINNNNGSSGTLINSQMPSGSKYGFNFQRNGTNKQFKMVSNGNVSTYSRANIYYGTQNIKIIRINGIMYYSLNDGGFTKCGDYTNFTNYFNTPVTFGASLSSNNSPTNFFTGKISNMMIKIIVGDDISLDDYLYSTDSFEYEGDFIFNGSTAINTGVYLFNQANITRNFYISFDIKNINWGSVNQSTLMSSKDESGSPWPGFELRRSGSSNSYFQSKATFASGKAHDVKNIPISTKNIRFMRINNILYYSLDGGNFITHYDFTNFNLYFDVPVVFGNAFNVETQRYFKGTLSNMIVKFIKDDELATYQDMLST